MLTKSTNQFRNYEFEYSQTFWPIIKTFTSPECFVKNNLIGKILRENSGFAVSEVVVGSGEQDT